MHPISVVLHKLYSKKDRANHYPVNPIVATLWEKVSPSEKKD